MTCKYPVGQTEAEILRDHIRIHKGMKELSLELKPIKRNQPPRLVPQTNSAFEKRKLYTNHKLNKSKHIDDEAIAGHDSEVNKEHFKLNHAFQVRWKHRRGQPIFSEHFRNSFYKYGKPPFMITKRYKPFNIYWTADWVNQPFIYLDDDVITTSILTTTTQSTTTASLDKVTTDTTSTVGTIISTHSSSTTNGDDDDSGEDSEDVDDNTSQQKSILALREIKKYNIFKGYTRAKNNENETLNNQKRMPVKDEKSVPQKLFPTNKQEQQTPINTKQQQSTNAEPKQAISTTRRKSNFDIFKERVNARAKAFRKKK